MYAQKTSAVLYAEKEDFIPNISAYLDKRVYFHAVQS
jgi:hypothetical protein